MRDRFEEALLRLHEAGCLRSVSWPDGFGPQDDYRAKGWVSDWLAARVRISC